MLHEIWDYECVFIVASYFSAHPALLEDNEALNNTLDKWINSERFGFFPKITRSNINHLMDTEKYIVIAVVSENKLSEISQTERDFKDMIEGIIRLVNVIYIMDTSVWCFEPL